MNRLIRFSALTLLTAGASACAMFGGDKKSDSGVAAGAEPAPAAGSYQGPPSDVKVDTASADHLSRSGTIIVPTVYVKMPVGGKVAVSQQGSALQAIGGGSTNSVKASARYKVSGVDKALAQQIAGEIYKDFVAQLRDAGYTVLTYDDIKDRDVVRKADRYKPDADWGLPTEGLFGNNLLIATPTDEQAFKPGLNGGVFSGFIHFGKTLLEDGTVVIPTYTVMAPQMWGEKGASYSTISAAIKGAPAMTLDSASVQWLTNKPKVEIMHGIPGARTKRATGLADNVGTLVMTEDTTSTAANALSKTLGMLSGTGSINSQSANYEMTIERDAYLKAAVEGGRKFNAEVARIAKEQRS